MKTIKKTIYIYALMLSLVSCNEWFDVQPRTEVKSDKLFENENGFKAARAGVYTLMAQKSLYGGELTMSFLDVLAQYYKLPNETFTYYYAQNLNYGAEVNKGILSGIWSGSYNAIANCNNLLENIEKNGDNARPLVRNIIHGEMLGVRALLHFDMLRLFASAYIRGVDEYAIPYCDAVSRNPFPMLKQYEVLNRIIKDCDEALTYLKQYDPEVNPEILNNLTDDERQFLKTRNNYMNWKAVRALQCRVALWKGENDTAYNIAKELVGTTKVAMSENIFALYSDRLSDYSETYFSPRQSGTLELDMQNFIDIYGATFTQDARANSFTSFYPNTTQRFVSRWFASNIIKPVRMPVITFAELYFILAECTKNDNEALDYLNHVRHEYGISPQDDLKPGMCNVSDELTREMRKQFIGLGQLFYYYKRRGMKSFPGSPDNVDMNFFYTMPLPDDEEQFGMLGMTD